MSRPFAFGGLLAAVLLIAFGAGSIVIGANGRSEVGDQLKLEKIVGTPDMKPAIIKAEGAKAGLKGVDYPTCSVAGQAIDTGAKAKCFASYMRIHTLEATGGQTYSEMPRFLDKSGKPTADESAAAVDPKSGKPVENLARNIWVTETALTTALNTSFFAQSVALFSIVMGIALLLTGIGFGVISGNALRTAPRREAEKAPAKVGQAAVVA